MIEGQPLSHLTVTAPLTQGSHWGDELPQSADADSSLGEGAFWKER